MQTKKKSSKYFGFWIYIYIYLNMQPKIYKEGNPGRPVISSANCYTTKILQYVDHHL